MKLFRNSLLLMFVLTVFATGCASNEKSAGKNDANKYEGVTIKIGVQGSGGCLVKPVRKNGMSKNLISWA